MNLVRVRCVGNKLVTATRREGVQLGNVGQLWVQI
jgi:hypothetical protein